MRYARMVVALVVGGLLAPMALADISPLALAPIGNPHFGSSISQTTSAFLSSDQYYVSLRVVGPSDAYIKSVTGLGGIVSGTDQYGAFSGGNELIESWWGNVPDPTFSATFEIDSHLGSTDPGDYAGLQVEFALAGLNGSINASRQWLFTGGAGSGWYVTDTLPDGSLWGGSGPNPTVPAPGGVVLGVLGLGIVTRLRRRFA